ncbi:hypothetical protein NC653_030034 [Populus alba x Populus x berolinensis]|uniref:Uncharacterized protein n=1 Tax=Populus alba x Populus x berolinensis TaxID=444605 RepID=A0AAD6M6A6_9ROSI|nr:hypothetical protein NC653_030034 [Populus alba x Populus x berolinensis]
MEQNFSRSSVAGRLSVFKAVDDSQQEKGVLLLFIFWPGPVGDTEILCSFQSLSAQVMYAFIMHPESLCQKHIRTFIQNDWTQVAAPVYKSIREWL